MCFLKGSFLCFAASGEKAASSSCDRPQHVYIFQELVWLGKKAPAAAVAGNTIVRFVEKFVFAGKEVACGSYDRSRKATFLKCWSLMAAHSSVS